MLNQNVLLFNTALKKAKHILTNNKCKGTVEEIVLIISIVSLKPRTVAAIKNNDYISEIPSKTTALAKEFVGLSQRKIVKVFSNRFRSMNLYKLRLMRGWNDLYYKQIHIDEGTLKIHKVTGLYKDYNSTNNL